MYSSRDTAVCRACLQHSDNLQSIFDGHQESFERSASLSVSYDDDYPKYLCLNCITFIKSVCDFKDLCLSSQLQWKSVLMGETTNTNYQNTIWKEQGNKYSPVYLKAQIEKYNEEEYSPKVPVRGQCNNCSKVFDYKKLEKHVHRCVGLTTERLHSLFCGLCKEIVHTEDELISHLCFHLESASLTCQICDYSAIDFADLFVHRYSHQPKGTRSRLVCFKCKRQYNKLARLEFHFRGDHLSKPPGLCKVCLKNFNNYNHFITHIMMHTGKEFMCELCEKKFKYEKYLHKHRKVHGVKMFMCDSCGYSSRRASGLKSHIFRKHTKHKPLECVHCGKTYKNKETMREHMLRVRSEKPFPCPVCDKTYRSEAELLRHQKWHVDEKPYVCDACGLRFKAKEHLKCHMRVHSGERPYACNICDMTFTMKSCVKKHYLTHSGEKPHVCIICGKKFAAKSNLKKHMTTHKMASEKGIKLPHEHNNE